jgi:hypothetical protein
MIGQYKVKKGYNEQKDPSLSVILFYRIRVKKIAKKLFRSGGSKVHSYYFYLYYSSGSSSMVSNATALSGSDA